MGDEKSSDTGDTKVAVDVRESGKNVIISGDVTYEQNKNAAQLKVDHTIGVATAITTAGRVNVIDSNPHQLDVSASHTVVIPDHGPNISTAGASVVYKHAEGHGVAASVNHTPVFNHTEASIQGNLNLHQDQNSSVNLFGGRSQSFSPHGRSKPNDFIGIRWNHRF